MFIVLTFTGVLVLKPHQNTPLAVKVALEQYDSLDAFNKVLAPSEEEKSDPHSGIASDDTFLVPGISQNEANKGELLGWSGFSSKEEADDMKVNGVLVIDSQTGANRKRNKRSFSCT